MQLFEYLISAYSFLHFLLTCQTFSGTPLNYAEEVGDDDI